MRFNFTESVVYQIPIRIGDRIGENSTADGLFLYHEGFEAECPPLAQLDGDFGQPDIVHNFHDQGWVAMKKGYLRVSELRYEWVVALRGEVHLCLDVQFRYTSHGYLSEQAEGLWFASA